MSGILGIVNIGGHSAAELEKSISPMMAGLRGQRGGPRASQSQWFKEDNSPREWVISRNVAMGCRQTRAEAAVEHPSSMISSDGRWGIVVDGTLYNREEVASELRRKDLAARTESTVETFLQAWLAWGISAPLKLDGSFAFFVIDFLAQRWWLVRDHCGSRPLFYTQIQDQFVFASSIAALKCHPAFEVQFNHLAIRNYLSTLRLNLDDQTLYQGVHTVRPGEIVIGSAQGRCRAPYWQPRLDLSPSLAYDQAVEDLEAVFIQATKIGNSAPDGGGPSIDSAPHRQGILLDGELDSSLLARLMADQSVKGGEFVDCVSHANLDGQEFLDRWQWMVAEQSLPLSSPYDVYYHAAADSLKGKVDQLLVSDGINEYFYGSEIPYWAGTDYDRAGKLTEVDLNRGGDVRSSLIRQYGKDRFFSPADHFLSVNGLIPRATLMSLYRATAWEQADADRSLERYYDSLLQSQEEESMAQSQARVLAELNLENRLLRLDRTLSENGLQWQAPFTGRKVLDYAMRFFYHFKIDIDRNEKQPWLSSAELQQRGSLQSKRIVKSVARRWLAGDLNRPVQTTLPQQTLHQCQTNWLPWVEDRLRSSSFAKELFQEEPLQAIVRQSGAGALWCWPIINLVLWADGELA